MCFIFQKISPLFDLVWKFSAYKEKTEPIST